MIYHCTQYCSFIAGKYRFVRLFSSNQGCCQARKPKSSSLADERPDLDFDYLLDDKNLNEIQTNTDTRKGIGNIQKVHELWNQIQNFKPNADNQSQGMEMYQNLWNQVSFIFNLFRYIINFFTFSFIQKPY